MTSAVRSGAGRPRDESKTPQILTAVMEVIAEVGYQALRVEAVAVRAGVSPGSVYRRWPTKQELVVAALDSSSSAFWPAGTGDPESDLSTMLTELAERLSEPGHSRLALLASDPNDPEVALAARRHIPPVRGTLRALFAARVGVDHPALDLLVDVGPALVWYRTRVAGEHMDAPALVAEINRYLLGPILDGEPHAGRPLTAELHVPVRDAGAGRKDAARNRQKIVAAAAELFRDLPYEDVRLDAVAERAGVSRATLARHVGTKAQLRTEVHTSCLLDLLGHAEAALDSPQPWDGVAAMLRAAGDVAATDRGLPQEFLRAPDDPADDGESSALRDRLVSALDAVLDRARVAGSLRPGIHASEFLGLVWSGVAARGVSDADRRLHLDVVGHGIRNPGPDIH